MQNFHSKRYNPVSVCLRLLNSLFLNREQSGIVEKSFGNVERYQNTERECAVWLRFIIIFWSPRVLKTALKFGTAAFIMNRYERLGFAVLMLCFAI